MVDPEQAYITIATVEIMEWMKYSQHGVDEGYARRNTRFQSILKHIDRRAGSAQVAALSCFSVCSC